MPTNIGSLLWSSGIDNTGLRRDANQASQLVGGVGKTAQSVTSQLKGMAGALGVVAGGAGLVSLGRQVIEVRGQFQQLGIAFETMLGSKEKSDKLMNDAVSFAAKTPFTLTDVATNIKQLMAMGIETENVMDTMKALGDVAAGVSVPISRVAINYGQVAVMGKLQGRELRDFAMAGIPLIDQLAKNLGKSKNEIQDMVTAGQIGFPLVEAAFKSMAGEGGQFYNLMEKQNASVTGQISNLTDKWEVMLNEIGKSNEGVIYSGISGLSGLISNYDTLLDVLGGVITVYGAYKVAVMLVTYEQKLASAANLLVIESNGFLVASEARVIAAKIRSTEAQKALNASMIANPWVIAAAAIAAVGYAIYQLSTYQTDLEKAISKTNLEIENETDKALDLFAALKVTKEGTEDWEKARQKIINQYGDLLPKQLSELDNLEKQKKALDLVTTSLTANIAERIRLQTLTDISAEYNPNILESQTDIVGFLGGKDKLGKERAASVKYEVAALVAAYKAELPDSARNLYEYGNKISKELHGVNESAAKALAPIFNKLFYNLESARADIGLTNDAYKKYGETIKEVGKDAPEDVLTTAKKQRLEIEKQLVTEEKKLADLQTKKGKDPLKDIADQEGIIKALKEKLGIKKKDEKEALKLAQDRLDYETEIGRKRIDARLKIDQELLNLEVDSDEKLRKQANLNYQKSLNEIATQKADQLKEYQELYGNQATLPQKDQDLIDKQLEAAKKTNTKAQTEIDKNAADKIKAIWKEVTDARLSDIDREKQAVKEKYADELKAAEKAGNSELVKAINKNVTGETAAITRKFKLDELDFAREIELRKNEIDLKGFNRENELAKLNFETFKKYQEKKIAILIAAGDPASLRQAQLLQSALDLTGLDENSRKTQEIANNFFDAANYASDLANAIGDSNEGLAELFTGVSKVANSVGDLVAKGAFSKEGMSTSDSVGSIISGATQLIGIFVGQAARNKKEMEDYYDSIISQQHEYNLALNEQLLLGDEIGKKFYTDYESKLSRGSSALLDANKNLQKGMEEFLSLEAIVGKKNVISGSNVLGAAGAGASIGAGIGMVVGSVVPLIGTAVIGAVGAVVGGIVGAIGGLFAKKKKDIVAPLLETYPDLIKANGQFNDSLAETLIANNKVTEATKATLQEMIGWQQAADAARTQMIGVIEDIVGNIGGDLRDALVKAFEDGSDAARAMGDVLNKVVEDYVSNLIFAATIGPLLDKLKTNMFASQGLDEEGNVPDIPIDASIADGTFVDDIGKFYTALPGQIDAFNQGLSLMQTSAGQYGFDLFDGSTTGQSTTSTGQIQRALTEDTGNTFIALQRRGLDEQKTQSGVMLKSNGYLIEISANTLRTANNTDNLAKNTEKLDSAVKELQIISDNTRKSYLNDMGL